MSGSTTGRKIIKRACDGCKVRKVKCSELPPCDGCIAVKIPCTFNKTPSTRGPRRLRAKTIQEIAQTQRQQNSTPSPLETTPSQLPPAPVSTDAANSKSRTPTDTLVLQLCVYRLRMFPVWPVLKVEEVIASLQRNRDDMEAYALANAVGAATIAQLKLNRWAIGSDTVTGESMERECQLTRTLQGPEVNLNTIRIAFFLHIYHENQEAGGVKSLLYLREAITMAQMIGLHRDSSYLCLSSSEQQNRRRIIWLLFVTERGVAILHRLPVILKLNMPFPSTDGDDETCILPAFRKLVNLFWIFDQSGAFDILQNSDADICNSGEIQSANRNCLEILQKRLQEVPIESDSVSDVQRADIYVTRQWMRAFLWRVSLNHGLLASSKDQVTSINYPIQIAKEFLRLISKLPTIAIEAHGPSMELKIYEIASSVTDAIANSGSQFSWSSADRPRDILNQLNRILSLCRGGNKTLVSLLRNKIAGIQNEPQLLIEPRIVEEIDQQWSLGSTDIIHDTIFPSEITHIDDQSSFDPESQSQTLGHGPPEIEPLANDLMQRLDQMPQQNQQFLDIAWEINLSDSGVSRPEFSRDISTQLQDFGSTFGNNDTSAAINRFLSNGDLWSNPLGDGLPNILSESLPTSQWF